LKLHHSNNNRRPKRGEKRRKRRKKRNIGKRKDFTRENSVGSAYLVKLRPLLKMSIVVFADLNLI
jgi:hypothetical protein